MSGSLRIDIVADLICPWCFIGKRRLERALAMRPKFPVARVWRPFQLNPDLPPDGLPNGGLPHERHRQLKFAGGRSARGHAAIVADGARDGIDFAFDRMERTPNTLNAHRLIRLGVAEGSGDAVVEALFRGYFIDGIDIGDIAALAAIAAAAGLDETAARTHLAGSSGTAEVLAEEYRARRIGIDAVPCFIIAGDYALAGAQDPEMFLPLFDLAAVARAPLEA